MVCLPGQIAGKPAPTGTSQGLRLALYLWELACRRMGRKAAPGISDQNAGTTAPLYFSLMNCFTSGECSAAASFFMASESLLSGRATRMFT
ncbi:hypothetical protein D3C79_923480 [compost metagenome]